MTDMFSEPMDWSPEHTENCLTCKEADARYAARNLAKESSLLTTTMPQVKYVDSYASSATRLSEHLSSTDPQPNEPPTIFRVSHKLMQCVLHNWNPAMYVPGHLCLVETWDSDA